MSDIINQIKKAMAKPGLESWDPRDEPFDSFRSRFIAYVAFHRLTGDQAVYLLQTAIGTTAETYLAPVLDDFVNRFQGNWPAEEDSEGKIPLQPFLNDVFGLLAAHLGPAQSRFEMSKRLANLTKPEWMKTISEEKRSGLDAVSLYSEQLADATLEPSAGQYGILRNDQEQGDLTVYDRQQLNLNAVTPDDGNRERLRPCDFIQAHVGDSGGAVTRMLVDTGAECGILYQSRIPEQYRKYLPTRLRLRLPFVELRRALGWVQLPITFPEVVGRPANLWFLVVEDLVHQAILGLNNMRSLRMNLECGSN